MIRFARSLTGAQGSGPTLFEIQIKYLDQASACYIGQSTRFGKYYTGFLICIQRVRCALACHPTQASQTIFDSIFGWEQKYVGGKMSVSNFRLVICMLIFCRFLES